MLFDSTKLRQTRGELKGELRPILLRDNARPRVAWDTIQNTDELGFDLLYSGAVFSIASSLGALLTQPLRLQLFYVFDILIEKSVVVDTQFRPGRVAQRITRRSTEPKIAGSNPAAVVNQHANLLSGKLFHQKTKTSALPTNGEPIVSEITKDNIPSFRDATVSWSSWLGVDEH
ncbi:hypothetical protein M514_02990 [Trichuris suis]|uniref:Uncharacterized protein n=1 Tax=Trichuris suis TaxID=68888 RepID=A0A085NI33_9BILA|nr:hypothetical protein M514_02990 [Trichuris suis]